MNTMVVNVNGVRMELRTVAHGHNTLVSHNGVLHVLAYPAWTTRDYALGYSDAIPALGSTFHEYMETLQ